MNMTLVETQQQFCVHVSMLILHIVDTGFEVTIGEAFRTIEQQKIYVKSGKSKSMNSRHLMRLAIDLNLFSGGEYLTSREPYKDAAEFWEKLHPDNVAGYSWGWDANHFERRPPK